MIFRREINNNLFGKKVTKGYSVNVSGRRIDLKGYAVDLVFCVDDANEGVTNIICILHC